MTLSFQPVTRGGRRAILGLRKLHRMSRRAAASSPTQRREGDISDAFASLSGVQFGPLEPRFAALKRQLVGSHGEELYVSWNRLLASLGEEIALIVAKGPKIVPDIDFQDLDNAGEAFRAEHKKRGYSQCHSGAGSSGYEEGPKGLHRDKSAHQGFPS